MTTAIKQRPEKKVDWDIKDRKKQILKDRYNLEPVTCDEAGYIYDFDDVLNAAKKKKKKK